MLKSEFLKKLKYAIEEDFHTYYDLEGNTGFHAESEYDYLRDVVNDEMEELGVNYDELEEWLLLNVWAIEPKRADIKKAVKRAYDDVKFQKMEELDEILSHDYNERELEREIDELLKYPVDGSYFDCDSWFWVALGDNKPMPGYAITKMSAQDVVNYYAKNVMSNTKN